MGAFEDFVNLELPRRSALLTVEIAGYDGDPNNPAAPAILTGAPKGTWYLRETPDDTFYRKDSAGVWSESGGGGGGGGELDILYSLEPLAASVDYNDVNAVDPPADKIFSTQQEIDDYLAAQSATNFKHIQKLWDALPVFVFHAITVDLAQGNHRAATDATTDAFDLSGKYFIRDGSFTFTGAAPSTWTTVVAAQTITSHQVLGAEWNPWVQVAGTPFAGQDLKGLFAVLDTGQACIIHDHDDSTLYLMQALSPVPTNGVSTVRVARPSTVLQNSVDGVTAKGSSACVAAENDAGALKPLRFQNVWFQSFGAQWSIQGSRNNSVLNLDHCLFDVAEEYDSLGLTAKRSVQLTSGGYLQMNNVSFRSRYGLNDQSFLYLADGVVSVAINSFFRGARRENIIDEDSAMNNYNVVCEDLGWQEYYDTKAFYLVSYDSQWSCQYISGLYAGKRTTFRAISHTGNAFRVVKSVDPFYLGFTHGVWFSGFQAAIVLLDDSDCDLSNCGVGYPGWQNEGAGNADVGLELVGGGRKVTLGPGFDVSGTVGDLRIEGVVGSYSDLGPESDPLVTQKLNIVSKE